MNEQKAPKIIVALIAAIALIIIFVFSNKTTNAPSGESATAVTITKQPITEENYSGSRPEITGTGNLPDAARNFVAKEISDFKARADTDVPDLRKQFGNDAPPSHYTIDIDGTYLESAKTASIILNEYQYTGGANGNGTYTVFTASKESGSLLTLSDIIQPERTASFTDLVKKELNARYPEAFPQEIQKLTFASFTNFSLSDTDLTLYFDKYAIGPGALGEIAFSIPLTELSDMLRAL